MNMVCSSARRKLRIYILNAKIFELTKFGSAGSGFGCLKIKF